MKRTGPLAQIEVEEPVQIINAHEFIICFLVIILNRRGVGSADIRGL